LTGARRHGASHGKAKSDHFLVPNYPAFPILTTARLRLRDWRDSDLPAFARLNADPLVMAFMAKCLSREESDASVGRIREHFDRQGFGLWAVENIDGAEFIGFTGLSIPRFTASFTPCVEVGWRFAADQWGRGYATEAARACLAFGFDQLGLPEIVSFTTATNFRSRRVMERIGMTRDAANDFEHPSLPAGHPLRPHVLYRALPRRT
jgi:RimJ/RimL family protein N-acetyltransferase